MTTEQRKSLGVLLQRLTKAEAHRAATRDAYNRAGDELTRVEKAVLGNLVTLGETEDLDLESGLVVDGMFLRVAFDPDRLFWFEATIIDTTMEPASVQDAEITTDFDPEGETEEPDDFELGPSVGDDNPGLTRDLHDHLRYE